MKIKHKRLMSLFLAVVMIITSMSLSLFAYAIENYSSGYNFQIYYYNDNNEFVEVTEQVQVMEQYEVQLYACLVYDDGTIWNITENGMPEGMENYSLDWSSDARYLAFCEENDGNVRGYDATKGEAIRNWLDNEVGSIPVVGGTLKNAILALVDNDVTDIDNLDTEDVIKIVNGVLEKLGLEEYQESLDASIREYLDKFDVGITATLKNENGEEVASDTVRVLVLKSDAFLSDVVPNAAFIKNYDSIPTTVAVGYEMDLEGIITPVRTHYACTWTVTGKYGVLGSDLATVDENGHFTALSEGEVQVKVSPDVNGVTQKITDAFNAFGSMGDLVDNESIAKALLLILGIKSDSDNYTTLVSIVTKVLESGVTVDGVLTFTKDNLAPLVNFILYVIYQDTISIKIVAPEDIPITSYELTGNFSVTEGESSTLQFANVKPDGAVAHDYVLKIENEEYAVMTDELTFLGIDGSTWNNNFVTSNKTKLICTMDGIENAYEVSVWGKDNKNVVYIKIECDEYLEIDTPTSVDAVTYPKRLDASLTYGWIKEDGTYNMATADEPAYTDDGLAYVTADGILYSTGCTVDTLVVQEANGVTATKRIMSGVQTTGVEFTKDHFWKKCDTGVISTGIRGAVCEVTADILPANASFNTLTFESSDSETIILSATPLSSTQFTSAVLTEARRTSHKTATVQCDENGRAIVYAYAVGNTSCYVDITVSTQTGNFVDHSTVAFANISVTGVTIEAEETEYLISENYYEITAGEQIHFNATVEMSATGSWKDQGFEDVEWKVSDSTLATVSGSGIFTARDVGTVTVTATSVFGEIDSTVTVKILPDYRELLAAMDECDYDNLDPYDWSDASWNIFNTYYQEAVSKLSDHSFTSQKEVDALTENIRNSFNALVRYLPLTGLDISCSDDADENGFAQINVPLLSNYTAYSTTVVSTVYPAEAEDYTIVFTSSNPDKITVDENGVCTPVSSGDAAWSKITVTVIDPKNGNEFSQEMYVAFAKYQVTSVSVSPERIDFVGIGSDAEKANETITPSYSTGSSITSASIKHGFFISSDENVAIVSDSGTVTPVGIGNCIITFYSYDGGYTATTNVSVTVNKNKLSQAIENAESFVEEFYTEESFAALSAVLADAKAIYTDAAATQQQVNEITAALNEAIDNLVKNPYANVYLSASEGGSILYNSDTYSGENNSVRVLIEDGITLTAAADEGYHFVAWKDDRGNVISEKETDTFEIDYSSGFTAVFEKVNSVTGIKVLANGNDTEYYTVTVSALLSYTTASAKLSYEIMPENANFYKVEYKTDSSAVTISSDGTVKPSENQTCYAIIDAVATNTITGEQFVDTITVSFVKYAIHSVSASPGEMIFNGVNADTQQISITYSASSSVYTPSLRQGFFVSDNETIASVDSNGIVTPVSVGTCNIRFTSYDGGKTSDIVVKVYADKSQLSSAINGANSLVKQNYTEESYNSMLTALAAANEVNNTEYALQSEVDDALNKLQTAVNNLVKLDLIDFVVNIDGRGTVNWENNTLEQSGFFTVKSGTEITVTAVPSDDSEFLGWYDSDGNVISTETSYITTVNEYTEITAKFNDIIYIQSIDMTCNGISADFVPVAVSAVALYSNASAKLGVNINPDNPSHYSIEYSLEGECDNLTIDGTTVKPASNNSAYGTVKVRVTDESNGKVFEDSIVVTFAKNSVTGIYAQPTELTFTGANSESQNVVINYSSSSVSHATIRRGFVNTENSAVADAATAIGENGAYVVVTPKSIGSTTAVFTSYDGGYTANIIIRVVADKTVLNDVLVQAAALNPDDYTAESFESLPAVIEYAQNLYDEEFASQEDVDFAAAQLISAIASLVKSDVITVKVSSIGEGSVTMNGESLQSINVERDEIISLNAVAEEDYEFEAWYDESGNILSTDTNFNFEANEAATVIAKFTAINVVMTYKGAETDFASVNVSVFSKYTSQSATFGVNVYPSNMDYTVVGYSLGSPSSNMSISGSTVSPSGNSAAYAQVIVVVMNNRTGKNYTDDLYVAFANNQVKSVSVDPASLNFDNRNSAAQTISAKCSGTLTPSVPYGFFVSSDKNIATVTNDGIVKPVSPGNCTITFYSYDGGHTATTAVTVGGNLNLSGKVVMMASPDEDSGNLPVNGAVVTVGTQSAETDEHGEFAINDLAPDSSYNGTVTYANGVTRNITVILRDSDKSGIVVPIIAVDYVNDGYINAKDYAQMNKLKCSDEEKEIFRNFISTENYSSSSYNSLTL